jgi:hypothetical protein
MATSKKNLAYALGFNPDKADKRNYGETLFQGAKCRLPRRRDNNPKEETKVCLSLAD